MKKLNGLPVYKMTIDENDNFTGVEFISLVDQPAIEVNWVAMQNQTLKLFAGSEDKQILTGPAMIPDLPIYRSDLKLGEYYVSFDTNEIQKIALKFNKEQRTLGINYMHQNDSQVNSAVIIEQWFITDKKNDKSNALGFDLPVGTWMVSVKIEDKKFWENEIKSGNVKGFSIEGYLNMEMSKMKKEKYSAVETASGETIFIDGDLKVDSFVYCQEISYALINGVKTEIQYPYYGNIVELKDGNILTIDNGKIVEIKQKENTTMSKQKFEVKAKTKEGVEITSPADAIAEGVEVYIVDADGNSVPAPDGDHTLEDGSVITVKDGKVVTIVAPQAAAEQPQTVETHHSMTPEQLQLFSTALGIADLIKRIEVLEAANVEMKKENTELKEKFAKIPAPSVTNTKDKKEEAVTLSIHDKLSFLKTNKKK